MDVPGDWSVLPLGELFEFRNGVNADKSAYGRGMPFINVLEVISNTHLRKRDVPGRVALPERVSRSFVVHRGDVLFNRTSETAEEVGMSSVYLDDSGVVFGGFVIRARPTTSRLDPTYAGYALRSAPVRRQLIAKGQGAIHANIGQADLRKVLLPVPESREQHAIAHALSSVDAFIESLDALIIKKRAIKQGAMQQLLTGRKRLPGFSAAWRPTRLGDVCEVVNGGTPSTIVGRYWDGHIPWCTPTDITHSASKYLDRTERTITEAGLRSCAARLLPVGSILLCSRATVGELRIAVTPVATNQGFKSLVCSNEVDNEFLYYKVQMLKGELLTKAIGSTFPEVTKRDVEALRFPLPSLAEQRAVSGVLSDMDLEILGLVQQRDKTLSLRRGLAQALLSGRVRLTEPKDRAITT